MAGWARGAQSAVYCELGKAFEALEEGFYEDVISVSICTGAAKVRSPTVNGHCERTQAFLATSGHARLVPVSVRRGVLSMRGAPIWLGTLASVVYPSHGTVYSRATILRLPSPLVLGRLCYRANSTSYSVYSRALRTSHKAYRICDGAARDGASHYQGGVDLLTRIRAPGCANQHRADALLCHTTQDREGARACQDSPQRCSSELALGHETICNAHLWSVRLTYARYAVGPLPYALAVLRHQQQPAAARQARTNQAQSSEHPRSGDVAENHGTRALGAADGAARSNSCNAYRRCRRGMGWNSESQGFAPCIGWTLAGSGDLELTGQGRDYQLPRAEGNTFIATSGPRYGDRTARAQIVIDAHRQPSSGVYHEFLCFVEPPNGEGFPAIESRVGLSQYSHTVRMDPVSSKSTLSRDASPRRLDNSAMAQALRSGWASNSSGHVSLQTAGRQSGTAALAGRCRAQLPVLPAGGLAAIHTRRPHQRNVAQGPADRSTRNDDNPGLVSAAAARGGVADGLAGGQTV